MMKLQPIEGNTIWLDGGSMFGNVPKELWKLWITPDEKNRIHLACRMLLLQTDEGKNILFEAGVGSFFDPKMRDRYGIEEEHLLLKNLEKQGIKETDIDAVVLSHLHFDHAGGLLSPYSAGTPRLLFPNATYYVGAAHWKRALQPHIREKASFIPTLNKLLEESSRLVLIEGPQHPDLPFVRFRYVDGHTIGLMLAEIQRPEGPLLFASDLIPGLPWIHLPVAMGYDRYPEQTVNEKNALFAEIANQKTTLFFTHDPHIPCARITTNPTGKYEGHPLSFKDES